MRLSNCRSLLRLITVITVGCGLYFILGTSSVAGQSVCDNCGGTYHSPTAVAGGPYVGITGQSISLDGGGSWTGDDYGWIDGYYWDFGDDTWGSGSNPSHQYNANGVYTVTLYVESNGNWASSQSFATVDSVSLPVRINFDELPYYTVVADQYLSQYGVRFSSGNSFYPVHTYQNCGACSTTSFPNYIVTKPDDGGQVTVEFTQHASNLTFYMIGVDAFYNQFSILDVYRNNALYATYPVYGNGTRTVGINLGSLSDISKVVIRGIYDPLGIGFDDITFTIPLDIKITSARVNGYLNGPHKTRWRGPT